MKNILLKELYIDNFKSFKDSKFKFGKVNCLIAPNNAGKSNLIMAMNFLNNLLYQNPLQALSQIDLSSLTNYHYDEKIITINAKFEIENIVLVGNTLIKYFVNLHIFFNVDLETQHYNLDVVIDGKLKYIDVDKFDLLNNLEHFDLKVYNDYISTNLSNFEKYLALLNSKRFSTFKLEYNKTRNSCVIESHNTVRAIVQRLFSLVFSKEELVSSFNFINIFNNISLFNTFYFDTNEIKKPELTGNPSLNPNGKNLVEVLDFLKKYHPEIFNSISSSLIGEVEMIEGLEIDNSSFIPQVKFQEEINGNKIDLDIWNVSDGTVHFIAMMTSILGNQDSVALMLEEPERHMHMRVLSTILNTMRDDDKQMFFTTHSTEILQQLELDEILFMFRDYDGDTKGQRAKSIPNIKKIMKLFKGDLVEMIQTGVLGEYDE